MSLKHAATHLAAHGRGPDTELVHMTKGEINSLQTLAKANGGSLTINPDTGLPEAGFLSSILPAVVGGAAMYFSGGAVNPATAAGLFGMGMPATIGLGVGALQTARTGSMQKGLMAGLGAYGGAGLAGGLMSSAAAAQAVPTTTAGTLGTTAAAAPVNYGLAPTAVGNISTTAPGIGSLAPQISAAGANAGSPMWKYGLAAAAPTLLQQDSAPPPQVGDNKMPQRLQYNPGTATSPFPQPDVPSYEFGMNQNFGRQQNYFPTAGYQNITPEQAKQMRGYAGGGPVEAMSNANALGANTGYPQADIGGHAYATPWQTPMSQNVVHGAADTGVNSMTGEMNEFANGGITGSGNLDLHIPLDLGGGGGGFGGAGVNGYQATGSGNSTQTPFSGQNNTAGGGFGSQMGGMPYDPTNSFPAPNNQPQGTKAFSGNPQEALKTLFSTLGGQPQQNISLQMATGGLAAAYAAGGMSHLGDYSDGGRLLKGPGDGVSDSIPATIGGKRPARLADGEFVVPARIVSELGNGSTEAGARKLYAMLDRVQAARKKSIGKGKVAKNSRADKFLPA
jgi:hypothetical protein